MRCERGQASVELVAVLPLVVLAASAVMCVLVAGTARERAAAAAQAGAMALIQGTDPRAAAREVVPEPDRPRMDVTVRDRRVTVRLVPRLPLGGLADRLAGTSTADAGPAPAADASTPAARPAGASGAGRSSSPLGQARVGRVGSA